MWDFSILPEQASTFAAEVDALYFFIVGITLFFTVAIYAMIWFFSVRYRRGNKVDRSNAPVNNHILEAVWIILPLGIAMAIFAWSAKVFFEIKTAPAESMQIHALGKQWMWKFVHEEGNYEVNELHVPVGRPVEITLISQDVLHDLFFPAFRTKMDAVPGRYTHLWFEATKVGTYNIFCAEYCGLLHSGMIGKVHVLEQEDYDAWLSGSYTPPSALFSSAAAGDARSDGEVLFTQLGCNTCHKAPDQDAGLGPNLHGIYGTTRNLADGGSVVVDDDYIRESVYVPTAKVAAGYETLMSSYKGQINEEQVIQLISYIKGLE